MRKNIVKKEIKPAYLDIQQAAEHSNLSISYLYKLVGRKEVPHIRAGYKILFTKSDLDNWLQAKNVATK